MGNSDAIILRAGPVAYGAFADASALHSQAGERKYLNRDERHRVLAAIEALSVDKALFVTTLIWSGGRLSEVLALTPSAFQVEAGLIAIRTLKRRRFHVREVPIPPALMRSLEGAFALVDAQADVAARHRRLWPWSRVTGWRLVKAVMGRAGISGIRACPKGMRHAFGVGTLQSGVPIPLVQRWMGHSKLSTTAIYTGATGPEELAFAARFWEGGRHA